MEYEITMPVLSDTMDKGKIVKWHVKEGDSVKKGDVIAEVESDKAIMEVQTFKDGVVKKLLAKEGDEIEVKKPIAIIETQSFKKTEPKKAKPKEKREKKEEREISIFEDLIPIPSKKTKNAFASPAAKKEAQKSGIDIKALQKESKLPKPTHLKDIEEEKLKRYFTPKALKILKEYEIDTDNFQLNRKYREEDIENFIKKHNIPKKIPLSSNQKAVIKNIQNSLSKPSFHIYETIKIGFEIKEFKFTAYLLKILAEVMQKHPKTRAVLEKEELKIYPNSNISVALAKNDSLYMVVLKEAQNKTLKEIDEWLREIKTRELKKEDFEDSTFGVSNLGMFEIEAFDALINKNDCAIAAVGKLKGDEFKITFTFDHRILNGVDAAVFVRDLKKAFLEEKNV